MGIKQNVTQQGPNNYSFDNVSGLHIGDTYIDEEVEEDDWVDETVDEVVESTAEQNSRFNINSATT